MNLWDKCEGHNFIKSIQVTPWRVVETQSKSYARKLVSTDLEFDVLEELLEENKPNVDSLKDESYHYLLFTPFRYPPLKYGSRFGRRFEPSIWYGSLEVETALHEVAYYRLLFLQDTEAKLTLNLSLSAYSAKAKSDKAVDLTVLPFSDYQNHISDPSSYEHSQPLGTAMRNNQVELFLYDSARVTGSAANIGIFYPRVFKDKRLCDEPASWSCYADKTCVEFRTIDKSGKAKKIICYAEDFSQGGNIHYPTTVDE